MSIQKNTNERKTAHGVTGSSLTPVLLGILMVALCTASYFLGALSSLDSPNKGLVIETIPIELAPVTNGGDRVGENSNSPTTNTSSGPTLLVGSVNSDIYHLPECPGAQRINEENRRTFSSYEEAHQAGYRAAKNCEGLE